MKISYNWLKQFIKIDLKSEETAAILTDLGLEVEVVENYQSVRGGLEGIVVGHVLTCEKHPDADRLSITKVDLGDGNPVQIVCGAPNVAVGQKVPVATIGTMLFDKDGKEHRQKARLVCVAGNSIESPRLLLLSASKMFPNGLANSSGQVGKNYMRHLTGTVYGVFNDPVHMYRGTTMAGIIRDEASNNPKRGFVGGYEMETLSLGLPFMAAFLNPGGWGKDFAWYMDHYAHMAGMWIVGEDMPRETNRITLNNEVKDKWGLAVPNVHFDDHPNDLAMRDHAFTQGERVYQAAGSIKAFRTPPYPSTHNLGTCRMGSAAKNSVCNKWGQTHDISNLFISDGSQFTSGGAENPTLTIVSLAIRQAEYIRKQMVEKMI